LRILITALGTGVGKEDKDIGKLRYHTIIVMTDADVDGSHIRTLLLTFFFRHFPELIERGYICIAQPPLYRAKKGKSERYLKDDVALEDHLIDVGTADLRLEASAGVPLAGTALKTVVKKVLRFTKVLDVLERHRKNRHVVSALVRDTRVTRATFSDQQRLAEIAAAVAETVQRDAPEMSPVTCSVEPDTEEGAWKIVARLRTNGNRQETVVNAEFCATPEFEELRKLSDDLQQVGQAPFNVVDGERSTSVPSLRAAVDVIVAQGRKGLEVQRYKGLGEMNPEQLWETTMNPETRTLLQVRVEDAYEADEIFSTLMGDEVEPRRRFIEVNALSVKNLDV
jgi:DNA gyrase subunit B